MFVCFKFVLQEIGGANSDLKEQTQQRRKSQIARSGSALRAAQQLDLEIHAPRPQNRRSTSRVQTWGWYVFCLLLRFRQFAHHPPQKYHPMRRSFVGMVRGSWSPKQRRGCPRQRVGRDSCDFVLCDLKWICASFAPFFCCLPCLKLLCFRRWDVARGLRGGGGRHTGKRSFLEKARKKAVRMWHTLHA